MTTTTTTARIGRVISQDKFGEATTESGKRRRRGELSRTMTAHRASSGTEPEAARHPSSDSDAGLPLSPWLTVREAAMHVQCGVKTIYREVKAGQLRATRVGGRRELRLLPEWIDAWLERSSIGPPLA